MTPTEARALAERYESGSFRSKDVFEALRSLADQVEALQTALQDFCKYAEACGDDSPEFDRAKALLAREET